MNGKPILGEKHMLGGGRARCLRAELPGHLGIAGISALARTFSLRIASAQPMKMPNSPEISGSISGTDPENNAAGGPIDRHPVVFLNGRAVDA